MSHVKTMRQARRLDNHFDRTKTHPTRGKQEDRVDETASNEYIHKQEELLLHVHQSKHRYFVSSSDFHTTSLRQVERFL